MSVGTDAAREARLSKNMSEEKVRKKIVDKCLKKTKFSPMEIEKLLDAYDSTVVI